MSTALPETLSASFPASSQPNRTLFGHPIGLFVLFFTEMWERFSYYGMRALLMLYMVDSLHYDVHRAGNMYGLYTGLVFLTPIAGGLLADRVMGQRKAILLGGLLMTVGQFTLMAPSEFCFYVALGLLVLGNGFLKPNISVIVGQLYPRDDPRRDAAFSIFYMGINLGAFFSPLVCGTLGQRIGWHWGFGAAGVGMALGLVVYLFGQRYLGDHGQLVQRKEADPGAPAEKITAVEWKRMAVLLVLGIFGNVVFWAAFEQAGSSLAIFAEKSTRLHVDLLNWTVPSSWLQSANPMFIIALAPVFSWLWVRLARAKREPSTPMKFTAGLAMVGAGFAAMMVAGTLYDKSGPVSMGWLLIAYLLNTCGELCISPVGLSVVTKLAPARFGSMTMGLWFASMALANWFSGVFAGEYETMTKAEFFSIPMLMAGGAGAALLLLVRPLRRWMGGIH